MLDAIEVMSGFKEIKTAFRSKCGISKPVYELELWFTVKDKVLHVHDMEDQKISMALALFLSRQNTWKIRLTPNSAGELLVRKATEEIFNSPNEYLNTRYRQLSLVHSKRMR